jgi:NTE family protein
MSRALVLGGGGPVGIAWETGLLAGLAEGGVDLGQADYILGTSAGAFVGSQVAMGRRVADMAGAILKEAERPRPVPRPPSDAPDIGALLAKIRQAAAQGDPAAARRELGAYALAARTIDEESFIRGFGRALAEAQADAWPTRGYACTAVDVETGEFVLWTADMKVGLARAVASSCSVPGIFPPITIAGRRYMDGGVRSATNADLAAGHDFVVVVAVRVGESDLVGALEGELNVLRDGGAQVELIGPDPASAAAFGPNLLDPTTRPAAAKAGLDQGRSLAGALRRVWGD